jgi:hypothetical protein
MIDLANPIREEHGLAVSLQYFGLVLPGVRTGGLLANLVAPARPGTLTLTGGAPGATYGLAPTNRPGGWGELRLDNTSTTYARVPDYPGLRLGPEFTVSVWLFINAVNENGCILSKFSNGAGSSGSDLRGMRLQAGTLYCTEQSTNPVSFTPATLQWLCVTLVNTTTGSTLYANRAVQSTGAAFTQWFNNTGPLRIGGAEAGFFGSSNPGIDGRVDAILMWSRALPLTEVRELVTLGSQQFRGLLKRVPSRLRVDSGANAGIWKRRVVPGSVNHAAVLDVTHSLTRGLVYMGLCLPGRQFGRLVPNLVDGPTLSSQDLHGRLNDTLISQQTHPGGFGSFVLNGSGSSYIELQASARTALATTFTLACWFLVRSIPGGTMPALIAKSQSGSNSAYRWYIDATTPRLRLYNGAFSQDVLYGNTTLALHTWYHGVAVYDGVTAKLYLNGQPDGSTAYTNTFGNATDQTVRFGNFATLSTTQYLDGALDDMRIYNVALSAAQAKQLYENALTGYRGLLRALTTLHYVDVSSGSGSGLRVPPGLWMAGRAA